MNNNQKKTKAQVLFIILMGVVAIILVVYTFGLSVMRKSNENSNENVAALGRGGAVVVNPPCSASTYQGVRVSFISGVATKTTVAGANNDRAIFRLRYSISTTTCDLYVPISPVATFQWGNAIGSSITSAGIFGYPENPVLQQNIYPNGYYRIRAGTQENFTSAFDIDLAMANSYSHGLGNYRLFLSEVKWDTTNAPVPSRSFLTGYTATSTSPIFTTNWVTLN